MLYINFYKKFKLLYIFSNQLLSLSHIYIEVTISIALSPYAGFKKNREESNKMAMSMKSIAVTAVIAIVAVILVLQINAVREFVGLSPKE